MTHICKKCGIEEECSYQQCPGFIDECMLCGSEFKIKIIETENGLEYKIESKKTFSTRDAAMYFIEEVERHTRFYNMRPADDVIITTSKIEQSGSISAIGGSGESEKK